MSRACRVPIAVLILAVAVIGCQRVEAPAIVVEPVPATETPSFIGAKAGEERTVAGVRLCWCPAGTFKMGSPIAEPDRQWIEAQVEVTLSRGFWAGKYEVTQGEWKRVVGEFPVPLLIDVGDDLPMHSVNHVEATTFCAKLTELGRQSGQLPVGWEFRLPTEAQWEYACRAGTTSATHFGNSLSAKQANILKPYNGGEEAPMLNHAAKVGSYPANAWGLHDLHGNIFEWCRDWYHATLPGGTDPEMTEKGQRNRDGTYSRCRRGGAWTDDGKFCRSAFRLKYEPERRSDHIGFRVVAVQP